MTRRSDDNAPVPAEGWSPVVGTPLGSGRSSFQGLRVSGTRSRQFLIGR